jgi:hypothetical protein
MALRHAFTVVALALLSGCATQTLQQATTFAKAGSDYTDAVADFLDVYVVTRVDVNSRNALEIRTLKLGEKMNDELPKTLQDFDARALTAVQETGRLRGNVRLLRAYFDSLNALATSNLPEEGGAALKSLGEAINDVNKVTGGDAARFTPEQISSIQKIGKLAVKAAVSAKLREALERDKEAVAWQLAWQETMLRALVAPVRQEYERELKQFRVVKLERPYADAAATLGAGWVDDRRKWVQSHFYVEAFAKAEKSAALMRSVWEDIVSGQNDAQSIRLILMDLREFTAVIRAYDEAERKK